MWLGLAQCKPVDIGEHKQAAGKEEQLIACGHSANRLLAHVYKWTIDCSTALRIFSVT